MEFAYNNNYQETIQMVPYKIFYRRKYRSPLHLDEIDEMDALTQALGLEMTQRMIADVKQIRAKMRQAQDNKKSYAD